MGKTSRSVLGAALILGCFSCQSRSAIAGDTSTAGGSAHAPAAGTPGTNPGHAGAGTPLTPMPGNELAAFAEGCFWGSEDTFRHVAGVVATAVGYSGGHTTKPSYEDVCAAEQAHYHDKITTRIEPINAFWKAEGYHQQYDEKTGRHSCPLPGRMKG
jgi:hypothetical protein